MIHQQNVLRLFLDGPRNALPVLWPKNQRAQYE